MSGGLNPWHLGLEADVSGQAFLNFRPDGSGHLGTVWFFDDNSKTKGSNIAEFGILAIVSKFRRVPGISDQTVEARTCATASAKRGFWPPNQSFRRIRTKLIKKRKKGKHPAEKETKNEGTVGIEKSKSEK